MDKNSNYLPTFSKKWWENIWYYYKWYIIGGIFALFMIVFAFVECAMSIQPDFTLTYIGGLEGMGQIQAYELEDKFALVTEDIDNDGAQTSKVNVIYLQKSSASEEMAAMYNMADIEMAGGDAVALLFDEAYLDRFAKYGFADLSEYVREFNIDESLLKRYDDGTVYAINMAQNPIFTELEGIVPEVVYLCVRPMRPNDRTNWQKVNYENGVQMARYIISGGKVNP